MTFSTAQAAQQNNRTADGKYATKMWTEAGGVDLGASRADQVNGHLDDFGLKYHIVDDETLVAVAADDSAFIVRVDRNNTQPMLVKSTVNGAHAQALAWGVNDLAMVERRDLAYCLKNAWNFQGEHEAFAQAATRWAGETPGVRIDCHNARISIDDDRIQIDGFHRFDGFGELGQTQMMVRRRTGDPGNYHDVFEFNVDLDTDTVRVDLISGPQRRPASDVEVSALNREIYEASDGEADNLGRLLRMSTRTLVDMHSETANPFEHLLG